jgi:hypothetical protein
MGGAYASTEAGHRRGRRKTRGGMSLGGGEAAGAHDRQKLGSQSHLLSGAAALCFGPVQAAPFLARCSTGQLAACDVMADLVGRGRAPS